jgi:hypothetical protein
MVGFIGTSLQLQLIINSSHIELHMNDVCLTDLSEESLTALEISDWSLLLLEFWVWVLCYDRRSAGQSVLEFKHPSGAYDQIFIIVWQLRVCWFGAPSLTRGRVCRLQLLLVLARAVILGSESLVTRDHILLSQIWDFPFRRPLWLAGSRWKYSTPPPQG